MPGHSLIHDEDLLAQAVKDKLDAGERAGQSANDANERTGFILESGHAQDNGGNNLAVSGDEGTRTFTITPTSADFSFFSADEKLTVTGADSVVWPDVEGIHYFYYPAGTTTLTTTQVFTDTFIFGPDVFAAMLYWDATNQEIVPGVITEMHGAQMDGATHYHMHNSLGTQHYSGLALNSITTNQSGDVDSHAQFGVDLGVMSDEDIIYNAAAIASTTGLDIVYLDGASAELRKASQPGFSVLTDITAGVGATGRLVYNEWTGAAWQLTTIPNNDFVLCHVFGKCSCAGEDAVYAVIGQDYYASRGDAEAAAETEIANLLTVLPFAELRPLGTVIFQTGDGKSNAVKASIEETEDGSDYVDTRKLNTAGIGASAAPGSGDTLLVESNAVYVSKAGSDSNTGLNISQAKLTIGAAITAAGTLSPGPSSRVQVRIVDGGEYTENITTSQYIDVLGPSAEIVGKVTVGTASRVCLLNVTNSGDDAVEVTGENCYVDIREVIGGGGPTDTFAGVKVSTASGNTHVYLDIGTSTGAELGSGLEVACNASTIVHAKIDDLEQSSASAFKLTTGIVMGYFGKVEGQIGLDIDGGTAYLRVSDLTPVTAYDVETGAQLYLFAGKMVGNEFNNGIANVTQAGVAGDPVTPPDGVTIEETAGATPAAAGLTTTMVNSVWGSDHTFTMFEGSYGDDAVGSICNSLVGPDTVNMERSGSTTNFAAGDYYVTSDAPDLERFGFSELELLSQDDAYFYRQPGHIVTAIGIEYIYKATITQTAQCDNIRFEPATSSSFYVRFWDGYPPAVIRAQNEGILHTPFNYTITDDDGYGTVLVTTGAGVTTITLPEALDNIGRTITFQKEDSGAGSVTIDRSGDDLISGQVSAGINNQYDTITLRAVADNTWMDICRWNAP